MYHGWGRASAYFEGWYFKLVDPTQHHALAVIPGVSIDANGEAHAFVQVMDGKAGTATYHRYGKDAFQPSDQRFELRLGPNTFSADGLTLDLPELRGALRFHDRAPWPKMLGAPGIMGWYSFVPFMECFHGVWSMDHRLEGTLEHHGRAVAFTGGRGYGEKDWGRSFPRAYVWMQTNHFEGAEGASLMASVAHIPWLRSAFIGFIAGFRFDGRLLRFATYTGARKRLHLHGERLELEFATRRHTLRIEAHQGEGVALASPLSGAMTGKINESLQAVVHAELLENGQRIFEGTARTAGLEVAGDTHLLVD
jgi:hypothetical protein